MNISVVIPSYNVKPFILDVISRIGSEVSRVYVVDDCCPQHSGEHVEKHCQDGRVVIIRHEVNQGVGGATMSGYRRALEDGADIVVKMDGDGQMPPEMIPQLIRPLIEGYADYTKGNRFFSIEGLSLMPPVRVLGNVFLSFLTKLSSGYWKTFDPTNGYTAIRRKVLQNIPFAKIDKRYFFESDMLFRLNTLRAVVVDVPMQANYGEEESGLRIRKIIPLFLFKHIRNLLKRIVYSYALRDFNVASLELLFSLLLFLGGATFGSLKYVESSQTGVPATSGTVMLAALPLIFALQMFLSFVNYDINNIPDKPAWKTL